ncbi:MAG: ACT domain-containing protein [Pseudomonadota bacterium]
MAGGETELAALLAGLTPRLDAEPYWFVTVPSVAALGSVDALATFREREGLSAIVGRDAIAAGTPGEGPYARIELGVHSSLEAVGLTAAVATALTAHGISANVVAAYHHDHVFVAWDDRDTALGVLDGLEARSRPS